MVTTGSGTIDKDTADKIATSGGVKRRSILALEGSWEARKCSLLLYALVALLISLFTSLSFLTTINLMPQQPSTTQFIKSLKAYQEYSSNTSETVKNEMKVIYFQSKVEASSQCSAAITFIATEQNKTITSARKFIANYCSDLGTRAWIAATQAQATSGYPPFPSTCPLGLILSSPSLYYVWAARSNSTYIDSTFTCDEDWAAVGYPQFQGYCFYAFYAQGNPANSKSGEEYCNNWDYFANIVRSGGSFPTTHERKCFIVANAMQNLSNTYDPSNSATKSFLESLQARMEYDQNYFLAWANAQSLLSSMKDTVNAAQIAINQYAQSAEQAYDNAQAYIEDVRDKMGTLQPIYVNVGSIAPLPPFPTYPLPNVKVNLAEYVGDLPSLSATLPTISLKFISNWPSFNPPPFPNSPSISIDGPNFTVYKPSVPALPSIEQSVLLEDIKALVGYIGDIMTGINSVDFIWRFVQWIQHQGLVIQVTRRNLVSMQSKVKQAIGNLLSYSVFILYLSLFLALSVNVLNYDLSFGFLTEELGNQCQNAVVTENTGTLGSYQTDLNNSRSRCDATIDTYNARTQMLNNDYSGGVYKMGQDFEVFYKPVPTSLTNLTIGANTYQIMRLNIGPANSTYKGLNARKSNVTAIENYVIDASLCTDTPEAAQVTQNMDEVTAQLKRWVSAVCFALVFTNVGNKMMIMALFNMLWIYLTQGFIFDEAFDSKRLRAEIRSKRITGIVMMLLGISFVIIGALNKLFFFGKL